MHLLHFRSNNVVMLDQITTRMKCNLVIIDTVRKVTVLQIVVSLLTTNVPIG